MDCDGKRQQRNGFSSVAMRFKVGLAPQMIIARVVILYVIQCLDEDGYGGARNMRLSETDVRNRNV